MNCINYIKCKNNNKFYFHIILESIFIFIVYITCIIGFHHLYIIKASQYEIYNNAIQIVSDYKSAIDKELIDEIRGDDTVEAIIPLSMEKILLNSNIQSVPVCIIGVNRENLNLLLEKYDCKLIKGRLPKNNNEILLNNKVANGKKVELNGYISDNKKVVGIIESPYLINFGYIDEKISSKLKDYCILILLKDGKEFSKEKIQNIRDIGFNVISKFDSDRDTNPIRSCLLIIILFIILLFIGCKIMCCKLGICCCNKREKVFKKQGIAYMLGVLLGFLMGNVYNVFIENSNGIKAELININYILITLLIPTISYIINKIFFLRIKNVKL